MTRNPYAPPSGLISEVSAEYAKLSKRERRARAIANPTTYLQFLVQSQHLQREYIKAEQAKIKKMWKAWDRYTAAAHALNLHPLNPAELSARETELARMLTDIPRTHGDTPTQRALWDARQQEANGNG